MSELTALNYESIVNEIESLGVMPDRPPSLITMQKALEQLLGNEITLHSNQIILVAGTNGKGSVCATLEALLLDAGVKVGLYTSPHLEETTERIRILGQDISKTEFCRVYQKVKARLQDFRLTHFETLTLMAVWAFFSGDIIPPLEKAIFEVGLGGTWDATNAIPHDYCIITSIDYDHQNLLGSTLPEIATNKFGIVTPRSQVTHSPFPQEIASLALKVQSETQSHWRESSPFDYQVEYQGDLNQRNLPLFNIHTTWGSALLTLPGYRGALNTSTALTAFEMLGYSPEKHLTALSKVRWPGRMEKLNSSLLPCPAYLSGDHNPHGIKSLLELLPYYKRKHLHILVGIAKDKDCDEILELLFTLSDSSIYLTETPVRGRKLDDYGNWLHRAAGANSDPHFLFRQMAYKANSNDLILVTGSLYLVGLLRKSFHDISST